MSASGMGVFAASGCTWDASFGPGTTDHPMNASGVTLGEMPSGTLSTSETVPLRPLFPGMLFGDPGLTKRLDWDTEGRAVGVSAKSEADIRNVENIVNHPVGLALKRRPA